MKISITEELSLAIAFFSGKWKELFESWGPVDNVDTALELFAACFKIRNQALRAISSSTSNTTPNLLIDCYLHELSSALLQAWKKQLEERKSVRNIFKETQRAYD